VDFLEKTAEAVDVGPVRPFSALKDFLGETSVGAHYVATVNFFFLLSHPGLSGHRPISEKDVVLLPQINIAC
jgi:hypothetical protein